MALALPQVPRAFRSGFRATLPAPPGEDEMDYEFVLCALRGGEVAYRCHVVRMRYGPDSGPFWLGDGVLYI